MKGWSTGTQCSEQSTINNNPVWRASTIKVAPTAWASAVGVITLGPNINMTMAAVKHSSSTMHDK